MNTPGMFLPDLHKDIAGKTIDLQRPWIQGRWQKADEFKGTDFRNTENASTQ